MNMRLVVDAGISSLFSPRAVLTIILAICASPCSVSFNTRSFPEKPFCFVVGANEVGLSKSGVRASEGGILGYR